MQNFPHPIDILVVGCGLTGAVVARELAEYGKKVLLWDRRDHIGGNMFDYTDPYGIHVHKYGPHTFHTNDQTLYDYICRFSDWQAYELKCGAEIDGKCTPVPFNFQTLDDFYTPEKAAQIKQCLLERFANRTTASVVDVLNCGEPLAVAYANFLFEKDYRPYSAKQWGVPPETIDPSILERVPLRFSYKDSYFDDTYQCIPKTTYADFFNALLNHPNIQLELQKEALQHLRISQDSSHVLFNGARAGFKVVYTGALDELFGCRFGELPYRSLHFEWKHEDIESKQNMPVVAYPQAEGYTRIVEYKKMPPQDVRGTTYEVEYPRQYCSANGDEPYYPLMTEQSLRLYQRYRELASNVDGLYCCGRLGDFKYYNMDQALGHALELVSLLKSEEHETVF